MNEIKLINKNFNVLDELELYSFAVDLFYLKIVKMQKNYSTTSKPFQALEAILVETLTHSTLDKVDVSELESDDIKYLKLFNLKINEIDPYFKNKDKK